MVTDRGWDLQAQEQSGTISVFIYKVLLQGVTLGVVDGIHTAVSEQTVPLCQ